VNATNGPNFDRERVALYLPRHPNTVWSADFRCDALNRGRRFRVFHIVDDFNLEAPHIEVDTSITSERLVGISSQRTARSATGCSPGGCPQGCLLVHARIQRRPTHDSLGDLTLFEYAQTAGNSILELSP
jgi:hypothetical protein